ncbi:uncharacterized protein [Parasteatoda tepidariorum]|uniref:uncharacterized protein isoform X2 n=1 Tax=Parasteatoda tepidariorum TaxID=114398 RepID=UPI0039BC6D22
METAEIPDACADSFKELVKWPKVILFGDSLTQRSFDPNSGLWGTLLANRLQRICDVVSRGFSGYNSKFCRIILPEMFSTSNVSDIAAFVILLGSNDSCDKKVVPKSCQYVSVEDYENNLEAIIKYLQKIGVAKEKIILMSPPPYCDENWIAFCKQIGRNLPTGERQTSQYASACINLAKKLHIDYVNIYEEMIKEKRSFDPYSGMWGTLLADKLQRICDVVNRGFSGYNSKFCRVILPEIFSTSNVSDIAAFVILLGSNDSCDKKVVPNSCQYVSLEDYENNLEAIIKYLQKIGVDKEKIILMSPPPCCNENWTKFCQQTGKDSATGERQTSQYAFACINLAKKLHIDYVNIYEEMIKEKFLSLIFLCTSALQPSISDHKLLYHFKSS